MQDMTEMCVLVQNTGKSKRLFYLFTCLWGGRADELKTCPTNSSYPKMYVPVQPCHRIYTRFRVWKSPSLAYKCRQQWLVVIGKLWPAVRMFEDWSRYDNYLGVKRNARSHTMYSGLARNNPMWWFNSVLTISVFHKARYVERLVPQSHEFPMSFPYIMQQYKSSTQEACYPVYWAPVKYRCQI